MTLLASALSSALCSLSCKARQQCQHTARPVRMHRCNVHGTAVKGFEPPFNHPLFLHACMRAVPGVPCVCCLQPDYLQPQYDLAHGLPDTAYVFAANEKGGVVMISAARMQWYKSPAHSPTLHLKCTLQ